jgi:PIN domain nuclease of toxin-antitoxin system
MRPLLDTHVWLWLQAEPERLSPRALDAVTDDSNDLVLSAASSWEIAITFALGKIGLPEPPATYVPSRMQRSGVEGLPVEHRHALAVSALPHHHRDPFDRLLVAQAAEDGLTIVTTDAAFAAYDVDRIDA